MNDRVMARIEKLRRGEASPRELLAEFYHVPVLITLIGFMIAARIQRLDRFRRESGVTFRGNDPWYHFRQTRYLLDHFPATMPFDPMTGYPNGANADQFGTLYDQIVSAFILVTSLGDPSQQYAGLIMILAAPVFAAAAIIPTYLIAARLTSRGPALVGVSVFALLPGTIMTYSRVGFYDHHIAEVFFQALGVLAFVAALSAAETDQPVWELVVDRDFGTLRRSALLSVGAGIAAALYMWAWPPGVLLVGITGLFFAVKLTTEVYHGRSPEPFAFVGTISMTVTALLMLVPTTTYSITGPPVHSLLHVVLPLGVALGCVFLSVLARQWEQRSLDDSLYPVTVGGLLAVTTGVAALVVPSLISTIRSNLLKTVGFSAASRFRTIGEVKSPFAQGQPFDVIYNEYRLALFTGILAAGLLLVRPLIQSDDERETIYAVAGVAVTGSLFLLTPLYQTIAGIIGLPWQVLGILIVSALLVGATLTHRYDATQLYILVWGGFITAAAFTQTRFNYYLAIVVAVFNALFIAQIAGYLDLRAAIETVTGSARELKGWQVITAVTVLFLVIAPFLFPTVVAWDNGGRNSPGAVTQWEESIDWMNEETPQPGTLGGADNAMDPNGTYPVPEDGDFDYPDGAYGVQSWWDYGHWITVHGERIPNANPFQQNAGNAARYLLAPNETAANQVLNETMDEGDQTRYVMVDHKMVTFGSKFAAPTVFNDRVSRSDFRTRLPVTRSNRGTNRVTGAIFVADQRYYDSQMVRLYAYHGSAANPTPTVVETQRQTATYRQRQVQIDAAQVKSFRTLSAARTYVENNPAAKIGGLGMNPTERVSALKHYRLVNANSVSALNARTQLRRNILSISRRTNASANRLFRTDTSWVKTFEKVPGATVNGSGAPAGAEISATVDVENPTADRTFIYRQYATADENGNFEMTLPYSTTGYENFGPENGYTNVSVQAASDYRFRTTSDTGSLFTSSATVTESQVLGVDDSPVSVELTETEPAQINPQAIQAAG